MAIGASAPLASAPSPPSCPYRAAGQNLLRRFVLSNTFALTAKLCNLLKCSFVCDLFRFFSTGLQLIRCKWPISNTCTMLDVKFLLYVDLARQLGRLSQTFSQTFQIWSLLACSNNGIRSFRWIKS